MTKNKILKLLIQSGENYMSGEKISEILGITRSGVWKSINSLRNDGYVIESVTNRGYRLVKKPSALSEAGIASFGADNVFLKNLHYFDTVTSTFDKLYDFNPCEGLTVAASHQTNGRGRLGRSWSSGGGGIYFSFMLLAPIDAKTAAFITLICAVAVHRAISKYIECEIKWPNDIVSGGKKICGILTKTSLCENEIEHLLVGIGVNVNITEFDSELVNASSIKLISGKEVDENRLFAEIMQEIDKAYYHESRESILTEYKKVCANLGKDVTIHYADGRGDVPGKCTDILPDGSMNVLSDGKIINVNSGEVSVKGIYESELKGK